MLHGSGTLPRDSARRSARLRRLSIAALVEATPASSSIARARLQRRFCFDRRVSLIDRIDGRTRIPPAVSRTNASYVCLRSLAWLEPSASYAACPTTSRVGRHSIEPARQVVRVSTSGPVSEFADDTERAGR